MEKKSQKRSLRDIIREKNPLNSASEFFNSKVKALMKELRNGDHDIRVTIIGSKNEKSLKDVLKNCKSLFNRKEYINSFIELDSFRQRLGKASSMANSLKTDINTNYKEYFINELARDEKDNLIKFREQLDSEIAKKSKAKAIIYSEFIKQAGFLDFFRSIFTQRGRALRAWEKAHGREIERMKESMVILLDNSNITLEKVNECLKDMSYALSVRDIALYLKSIKQLTSTYDSFNNKFIKFYEEHIKDLISDLKKEEISVERNTQPGEVQRNTEPMEAGKSDTLVGIPMESALKLKPENDSEDEAVTLVPDPERKAILPPEKKAKKARENLLKLSKLV